MINKVGAFTSFGGDLKIAIVGNMVSSDYFNDIPDAKIKNVIQKLISETKEDLDNLANTYSNRGVEVYRPKITHNKPGIVEACGTHIINPMPNFQPHDHVFCLDNKFINLFFSIGRYYDHKSIQHIVEDLDSSVEYIKINAPTIWDDEYYDSLLIDMEKYPGDRDTIIHGPAFYQCGKHIFYTTKYCISPSGLELMKQTFPQHTFVPLTLPFHDHLDAQIKIIKPGYVLTVIDPDILIAQVPQMKNWNILYDPSSWLEKKKYKRQTYTDLATWVDNDTEDSSMYLGIVNIRPDLVAILKESKDLCKTLEKAQIDWVVCPLRHAQFWNFSLQCSTAIVHREDRFDDYLS